MGRLFPCIPVFRGGVYLKSVKKCVCVARLKMTLMLVKNVCFGVKKGMSKFWCWVDQNHTTEINKKQFGNDKEKGKKV